MIPVFGKLDQIGIKYARNSDQLDPLNILSIRNDHVWINVERMVKVSFIIQNFHKWQSIGYNFNPDTKIQDHIINYPQMMDHMSADVTSYCIQK